MEKQIKSVIESLLFIQGEPVSPRIVTQIFDIPLEESKRLFKELKKEYENENRGIQIRKVKDSFQFVTLKENYDYIKPVAFPARERGLSNAALEVLAIVAYKQPITKPAIDAVRGIKSERIVAGLIEKGLVEEAGKSDAIGKPMQYKTTSLFLERLNIENLSELPPFGSEGDDLLKHKEPEPINNQLELEL
jgi:segregation and condensation protein B